MLYTIPDYYKEFQCIADKCEDTCCAGWQIVIDRKSLNKYRKTKGKFAKRLRRSIQWRKGIFKQSEDKRCAFLNEQNLCDMYTALGENSLCQTCKKYPRHIEEFENVREITLSVSCPEVARILLNKKEPVSFLSFERQGDEEYEDFDPFLYSVLVEARKVIRKILQDRNKDIAVRVGLVLGLAHDMQVRIKRRELFSCDEVFAKYQKKKAAEFVEKKREENYEDKKQCFDRALHMFRKLYRLELLHEEWAIHLEETEALLFGKGAAFYAKVHDEFEEWLKENMPDWQILLEQLLVYFVYTYFCGAVYDGRVYSKARMAVVNVFFIYEMFVARWLKNERILDMEDVIMLVYRYSREIEHSDENLEKVEAF